MCLCTDHMYLIRRVLGHSRDGYKVSFTLEPESWFRDKDFLTAATPYPHIRQFVLELIVSTSSFLAGLSSNMTCLHLDGTWGSCEPIYGLGIPIVIEILGLAHNVLSDWWITGRQAKERSNEFILPPLMCRRELQERVDNLSCFGEHDLGRILADDSLMQNHGLLRGCPWRPTMKEVEIWL